MGEKSRVVCSIVKEYNEERIYDVIKKSIETLGGIDKYIKKDEKVLVKPNFLYPAKEEKGVTTNPVVIKETLNVLKDYGIKNVKCGDSPGNGSSADGFKLLNLDLSELGVETALMNEEALVKNPSGKVAKSFYLCKDVVESDAIIGVCKMKTHMLERITGAVKNMYGLIYGKRKALGHVNFPDKYSFAKMLADLHNLVKPRFHIMDGILAMEGNGPASGVVTKMNVILVSNDPVALDSIFSRLVYLDPALVPTNVAGELLGVGKYKDNEVETYIIPENENEAKEISLKELVSLYGNPKFDVQREKEKRNVINRFLGLTGQLGKKPHIDESKCVKCGVCVNHCPVEGKAVNFLNGKDNPPTYDYKKCIRCFCCQEMCPMHAIDAR